MNLVFCSVDGIQSINPCCFVSFCDVLYRLFNRNGQKKLHVLWCSICCINENWHFFYHHRQIYFHFNGRLSIKSCHKPVAIWHLVRQIQLNHLNMLNIVESTVCRATGRSCFGFGVGESKHSNDINKHRTKRQCTLTHITHVNENETFQGDAIIDTCKILFILYLRMHTTFNRAVPKATNVI